MLCAPFRFPPPTSHPSRRHPPVRHGLSDCAPPYYFSVRPKPLALTTKRVHVTRLFGAVCRHPPAGSAPAVISCHRPRHLTATAISAFAQPLHLVPNPRPLFVYLRYSSRRRRRILLLGFPPPALAAPLPRSASLRVKDARSKIPDVISYAFRFLYCTLLLAVLGLVRSSDPNPSLGFVRMYIRAVQGRPSVASLFLFS
jgi:hypothetical protein